MAYRDLLNGRKKEGSRGPALSASEETQLELTTLRQMNNILKGYASKHEVELTRFLEPNLD